MKNILKFAAITSLSTLSLTSAYAAESTGIEDTKVATNIQDIQIDNKNIRITEVWARSSIPSNNNSAVYMQINNPTDEQIVIIGASAAKVANNVELHESFVDEQGVSKMTALDKIVVPAKSTIELAPGRIHIMLTDLKKNLVTGEKFELTLKLEGKDPIVVDTYVK